MTVLRTPSGRRITAIPRVVTRDVRDRENAVWSRAAENIGQLFMMRWPYQDDPGTVDDGFEDRPCDECGDLVHVHRDTLSDTEPLRCETCVAKSKVSTYEVWDRGGLKAS